MASQTRYEVLIPSSGQDIASVALKHIGDTMQPTYSTVERNREVYMDGSMLYFDVLQVQAESSPQADSTLKQLGVYVADVTGHSPIYVSKLDKSGIQVWPMQFKQNHTQTPSQATTG